MGGEFWNTTGATFNDNSTGNITGDAIFTNTGTFNKQTNGGEALISGTFRSLGTVNVKRGQLTLQGTPTFYQGSTLTISADCLVECVSGTDTFSGNIGGDDSGFGMLRLASNGAGATPTVTVGSINLSTNLDIYAGILNAPGTFYTNWYRARIQGQF